MDGHGVNGHQVSLYVRNQLPVILHGLMNGLTSEQACEQASRPRKKNEQLNSGSHYFP